MLIELLPTVLNESSNIRYMLELNDLNMSINGDSFGNFLVWNVESK